MCLAVNMDLHPSSHSWSLDISAPGLRWVQVSYLLALVVSTGLSLSSPVFVSCIILLSGINTRIFTLLVHDVFT